MNTAEDPWSQNTLIKELEARNLELTQSNAEYGFIEKRYMNSMNQMHKEIRRLACLLDSLHEDVKERMADRPEDPDSMA